MFSSNLTSSFLYICFNQLCGVSILRAGEALEDALVSVCKDVKIGKILIQTNIHTTEPEVSEKRFKAYSFVFSIFLRAQIFALSYNSLISAQKFTQITKIEFFGFFA